MSCFSRREFINKSSIGSLGLISAAGLLSRSGIYAQEEKTDTKTGATQIVDSMPSIEGLPEIYDIDDIAIKARKDNPVAVVKSQDAEEAAYEVLALLKPELRADRAFIKVNTSTNPVTEDPAKIQPRSYYHMTTTQPEFVKGVIEYLHDQGIKYENITIGDGVLIDSTKDNMEYLGFYELGHRMGCKVVDLTKEPRVGYRIKNGTLLPAVGLAKVASDHFQDGIIVNVPKLKVHHLATLTLSIKNMMGCIQLPNCRYVMHLEFHTKWSKDINNDDLYYKTVWGLSNRLIDLYTFAPDFSVIDGIVGGEGHGVQILFRKEKQITFPVESHRAFASTNSINLDAICAHFMGHNPMYPRYDDLPKMKYIPWLYLGQRKKYGYMYIKRISVLGDHSLIEPEYKYKFLPELVNTRRNRAARAKERAAKG